MTPAERVASESWEQGEDCAVVVAGDGSCVAVVGIPDEAATPEDWARLPLVIAAPQLLRALRDVTRPLSAALADGVRVDPEAHAEAIRQACTVLKRFDPRREQMDNPFDGRGTGVAS